MVCSSLTRDQTQAPCTGSVEAKPLDHQESPPCLFFFKGVFILFYLFSVYNACGILAHRPGIKPAPPALEVQSLNYWITREVPILELCKLYKNEISTYFLSLIF